MNGTPFKIGDREFIVPRLRVGTFKRVTLILHELDERNLPAGPEQEAGVLEWYRVHCRAIREVLVRNYPELTIEDLEELVDLEGVTQLFIGLMEAAGRKRAAPGEAPSP